MQRPWMRLPAACGAAAVLAGCGSGYLMENQVQSFSRLPGVPAAPTYSFERLPSQAQDPAQNTIEAAADPALFRAGLRRDDAAPRLRVQVSARVQQGVSPWADAWHPHWPGRYGFGAGRGLGMGFGFGWPSMDRDYNWFYREVSVVMRDAATQQVVFESRAVNDGPWLDSRAALQAMFDAAMQGFPNPPPGPRTVNVQLGGRTAPAPAAAPAPAPAATPPAAAAAR